MLLLVGIGGSVAREAGVWWVPSAIDQAMLSSGSAQWFASPPGCARVVRPGSRGRDGHRPQKESTSVATRGRRPIDRRPLALMREI
jgi:hypothetical protein